MMHIDMSSDPTMAATKTKASGPARQKNNAETLPTAPLIGAQLREAREARNLTLDAVADELMIRKYYLQALEEGAYRNLPERVYAIGFVQNYSQLLGMDTETLTEQFKREAYGSRGAARVELNMPTPASQSMLPSRPAIFAVGGLLLILVIGGIVWSSRSPEKTATSILQPPVNADSDMIPAQQLDIVNQPVISDQDSGFAAPTAAAPPVPETTSIVSGSGTVTTTDPASVPALAPTDAPATAAAPAKAEIATQPAAADPAKPADAAKPATTAPAGTRILIEALEPSWVEIADGDGNILYTNILRVGQALPIPNKPGVTLTTGNAAGIQIILDGKKIGALGGKGDVKRAISLDPEKLSKR
ncbi:MAG TPA: RodZ domain-containing protein [Alphaproteobacteria bacterium]